MALYYLDASAVVKLVQYEPESSSLRAFVAEDDLVSCELLLTEVPRAIRRATINDPSSSADRLIEHASRVLEVIALLAVDRPLLLAAGALADPGLRALDAIHVVAAVDISPIDAFVSYDERQAAAARLAGLWTEAPGRVSRS